MRVLYLECGMGAAGDMLAAALYELLDESGKTEFLRQMNGLLPEVHVAADPVIRGGIRGTQMRVTVHGREETAPEAHEDAPHGEHFRENHPHGEHLHEEHPHGEHFREEHPHGEHEHGHHPREHRSLARIEEEIRGFALPVPVKERALAVYRKLAEAESFVHGTQVEEIHFHEVGALDAVADITGVCLLMEMIGADRVAASPVNLGSGQVRTAHGILPVPAPATARLLCGVPAYTDGRAGGELCTPTGAALLREFVREYSPMPPMRLRACGYGMGKKEFYALNCVRAFLGESEEFPRGRVCELVAGIDDMTPEAFGFALNLLMENGALDACAAPVYMKKNRPAYELVCLCREEDADRFAGLILRHTSTFGVRRRVCERDTLDVSFGTVSTPYGEIRVKTGSGYGVVKWKPEYADMERAAKEHGVPLEKVRLAVCAAVEKTEKN